MGRHLCPLCGEERNTEFLGPYTVTLECGATFFTGKPHPNSEITARWWWLDEHRR